MLAAGWRDIGKIIRAAATAVWSEDPVESSLAMARLSMLPPKLFVIMYEPWESTLWLELTRERLEVMKVCATRLHLLTGTMRAIVARRVFAPSAEKGTGKVGDGKGGVRRRHKNSKSGKTPAAHEPFSAGNSPSDPNNDSSEKSSTPP